MTLKKMYPAIVNSPGTELAADITATSTQIDVVNAGVLPPAPNLLTIGSDETAETVRYSNVSGNTLTVERSFQGVAKSWSAGAKVARYFTAYDHDAFRENIESLEAESADMPPTPVNLTMGTQIVNADETSPVDVTGIKGRTLVNVLGRMGRFDKLDGWGAYFSVNTLESGGVVGDKSLKIAVGSDSTIGFGIAHTAPFKEGKDYVIVAELKNGNAEHVEVSVTSASSITQIRDTTKFTTAFSKIRMHSGMRPEDYKLEIRVVGAVGTYAYVDAVRVYEIVSTEYDALDTMTADQVAAKYPYVDSLQNVANPYAIGYGENLLPSFTEWVRPDTNNLANNYDMKTVTTKTTMDAAYIDIPVLPMQDYTVSVKEGRAHCTVMDTAMNGLLRTITDQATNKATFKTPAGAVKVRVHLLNLLSYTNINDSSTYVYGAGTFKLVEPMLTLGNEAKPFTPRQDSTLALTTELASNIDGTVTDELFTKDGQYWKLAKWKKMTLDGSLGWAFGENKTGFKTVWAPLSTKGVTVSERAVKYNGKLLTAGYYTDMIVYADFSWIDANSNIQLSIPNVDSGWGDTYTPTADEIKAYFNGWKMYDQNTTTLENARTSGAYNGTGVKAWVTLIGAVVWAGSTNQTTTYAGYTPYQLQYQLATPTVEPVPHEGKLMLHKGANVVECGVGMEVREKANTYHDTGYKNYLINDYGASSSILRYGLNRFITVYRNGVSDSTWSIIANSVSGAKGNRAVCKEYDYDQSATYHVTYTRLENNVPFSSISGQVSSNLRGTVNELVDSTAQLDTRLSVVERMKAEKDTKPVWIKATLLNSWVNDYTALYSKDQGGAVRITGRIKSGAYSPDTTLFILPVGHRPSANLVIPTTGTSNGVAFNCELVVTIDGRVSLWGATGNTYINLVLPSFIAEQ